MSTLPTLTPSAARDVLALLESAFELTEDAAAAFGVALGWALAARPSSSRPDPRAEPEGVPVARVSLSQRPPPK